MRKKCPVDSFYHETSVIVKLRLVGNGNQAVVTNNLPKVKLVRTIKYALTKQEGRTQVRASSSHKKAPSRVLYNTWGGR